MKKIINQYTEGAHTVIEYGDNGAVTNVVKVATPTERTEEQYVIPKPTIEEEILVETRYQTMLLEMSTLGGM